MIRTRNEAKHSISNILCIDEQVLRGVDAEFMYMEIGVHPSCKIRHTVVYRRQPLEHKMSAESYRVIPKTKEYEQVPRGPGKAKGAAMALNRVPWSVLPGRLMFFQQLHAID
jgi:hypothetical protein